MLIPAAKYLLTLMAVIKLILSRSVGKAMLGHRPTDPESSCKVPAGSKHFGIIQSPQATFMLLALPTA